jgi:HlyD family secretion protein
MMKSFRFGKTAVLAAIGIAVLAGFVVIMLRSGPWQPIRVSVVRAEAATIAPSLFGIATVEARRSYFIGPTAAGRVQSVRVDVGDPVRAGELLAEIDPVDLDDRMRSQAAASARAQSTVVAAEAQRKDAVARHELARINARRYDELGEKRFVSHSTVESKQQELTSAQAALEAAEANLAAARKDLGRLDADQAGLRQQRQNLRLVAPRAGIVTSRDAEPGSTVVAGQAVVRLIEPDSLWVKARFDQARSQGLAAGLAAEVVPRSQPATRLAGKVVRIEPLSDSVTEERIAFIAFDRPPAGVTVGELAEVTVTAAVRQAAVAVPNAAIKQTRLGVGVWVLRDRRPEFVKVDVGERDLDGWVEVRSGLAAGDEVVVHSDKELAAGVRVEIVADRAGARP